MTVEPHCIREHRDPEFTVEEHKSQVIFLNNGLLLVHQIQVDGCVFINASDGKRCDWLVNMNGTDTSIFVELKGSDAEGAFVQLAEAQAKLSDILKRNITWIVCHSTRPRFRTKDQALIIRARRDHQGAKLRFRPSPYYHPLQEVA